MKTPFLIPSFTLAFLKTEAGSGFLLAACALLALLWANSPWAGAYFGFIDHPIALQAGAWRVEESVLGWTKEGLMSVFFFVVGLEIKYEALRGALSDKRKLALPVIAALGGMIAPALVCLAVNAVLPHGDPAGLAAVHAGHRGGRETLGRQAGRLLAGCRRWRRCTIAIGCDRLCESVSSCSSSPPRRAVRARIS